MHSECSKVSYYQPKNQHFFIINQQPKFCDMCFSKINPDAHFGIKTFTFYKGGLKPKKCKKNGGFTFFTSNIKTRREYLSCIDVDSDSCQGGSRFFFIKMVQSGAF